MEDTAVLYCHGPGCGSRSFLWSSGRYKGCDCGAAVGGGIQAVPMARGGMGNGGAWGRRTSFPAAPTALNCSGVHGDKLLNCMWKNPACHCLLRAARPAGPAQCGKIKAKCYRRSERHRQHLGPGEVEGLRCWKSAHVVICPPLGPRPPWQSCLPGAQGEGWHKPDPPRVGTTSLGLENSRARLPNTEPVVSLFIYLAHPVTPEERFPCPYANSSPAE